MNVLIVDTDKIPLDVLCQILKNCQDKTTEDWMVIPKGIDIMQDISVDWMKMIRDKLDEKIREIEGDTLYCPLCEANHQYITGEVLMNGERVVSIIYRCNKCGHVWEVKVNGENLNSKT